MLQCNVMYVVNSKPEIKTKYYCSDYKIHIRLKDINSKKE